MGYIEPFPAVDPGHAKANALIFHLHDTTSKWKAIKRNNNKANVYDTAKWWCVLHLAFALYFPMDDMGRAKVNELTETQTQAVSTQT